MTLSNTEPVDVDALTVRVASGGTLSADELTRLAASPDILQIGMLADAVRRHVNGDRVTFLRVALVEPQQPITADTLPSSAQHVRIAAAPDTLEQALHRVSALRATVGERTISGFSWPDVDRWAASEGSHVAVLARLRENGLEQLAEVPIDLPDGAESAVAALVEAGFEQLRLTTARPAPMSERLSQFFRAARLAERFAQIDTVSPLPLSLNPLRPTTGYDDVKAVAVARLVMPRIAHVQVDWLRYGPKLAQVALTFGADDIDNVSPSDDAPDGRRRAPIEELRRNVEAAGFTPVERDSRFVRRD